MSLVNTIQNLFPNLKDIKSFKTSSAGYSLKYKGFVIQKEFEEKCQKLRDELIKAFDELKQAREELREVREKYELKKVGQEYVKSCEEYVQCCERQEQARLTHLNVCESNEDKEGVIIKLSFEPLSKKYNSQIVEGQIYNHVIKKLRRHTPHLPKLYGVKVFESAELSEREKVKFNGWGHDENFDQNVGQVIVIKNVGPTTLWSVWEEECENPHIAFQVLYTIACFERVGLRHNDLHLYNIFVQDLGEEPTELRYEIGGEVISFNTTKLVKIIDYDRSSVYHDDVERNGCLDDFQEGDDGVNQFNGINTGHDTYKFLRSYKYDFARKLKTWLQFECPSIFETTYPSDLLPQDVNPRSIIPETVQLLKSLVENFTEHFSVSSREQVSNSEQVSSSEQVSNSEPAPEITTWRLPKDISVKPINDTTKFPVCKMTRSYCEDGLSYMYKELRSLGYNWRLHHCKLFEEVKEYVKAIRPNEKEPTIYRACMNVTNPLRNKYYDELETLILEKYKPVLFIPQKYFPYPNDENFLNSIANVDEEDEDEEAASSDPDYDQSESSEEAETDDSDRVEESDGNSDSQVSSGQESKNPDKK